jgi:hypothetical protein
LEHDKGKTQKDLLHWHRHAPLRMARTRTELLNLLAFYNPKLGWDEFIRMIDFSGVTPTQIYQVVVGRSPDSPKLALGHANYDPAVHFREALLSPEFRRHIQSVFLLAYPDKGRDVFIHVPKCAGTDLILNLGQRSVPLPKMLELDGWVNDTEFLEIVAGLARAAASHDRLFAYGHMELGGYVSTVGVRPLDRIFTVLRDPIDLLISQANYAIGRVRQDPQGNDPDAAQYLSHLGLTSLPDDITRTELKDMTLRALLDPRISQPNRTCFYLGRGNQCRYSVAMENLIVHNVEITTTQLYNRWLKEQWGIAKGTRHNRSDPIISNAEARNLCAAALAESTAEDQKLFDVVSWALKKAGTASITGTELGRLVGPDLLETLPRNAIPALAALSGGEAAQASILMAETPEHVAMYLSPVSVVVPGSPKSEVVVTAEFGVDGLTEPFRLEGWAKPEKRFTWTNATESTIRLPPLPGGGSFVFRLIGSPFLSKGKISSQSVELMLGGVPLGGCNVRDMSVLECALPSDLLHRSGPIDITLRLPAAARPSEVSGANDDRLLALAVHSVAVLRVTPADAE